MPVNEFKIISQMVDKVSYSIQHIGLNLSTTLFHSSGKSLFIFRTTSLICTCVGYRLQEDLCCQRIVNDSQHTSISHYLITRTASSTPRNTDSLLGRLLHLRAGVVALSQTHYAVHHCPNLESRGNWRGCNLVSL